MANAIILIGVTIATSVVATCGRAPPQNQEEV
jgi:hypothetical protein